MNLCCQRILEWLPFPSPGDLPGPGIKPVSPAWQVDSLPLNCLGNPHIIADTTCNVNSIPYLRVNERLIRKVSVYSMFMVPLFLCFKFIGTIPTEQSIDSLTDSLKLKEQSVAGNSIKPAVFMVPDIKLVLLLSYILGI